MNSKPNDILLSVIVISHNQREELRRCLDSILAMDLSFPYEIIVSDDRSTDGSYELAQEYEHQVKMDNLVRIIALQCNSDLGNCANNSQRSGYNRCNAYPHASGKYIAHVDADDYFRPNAKVYEKQVAALEAQPECSLAMSTCLCIDNSCINQENWKESDLSKGSPWGFPRTMTDGEVIDKYDFVRGDWFRLNQCFIQRRNSEINPVGLYGNRYVDSVITYHHLQFGDVVYVDACDYVYIGHSGSVVNNLAKQNNDRVVLWCLGLYIPALIKGFDRDFFMGAYYCPIRDVVALAASGYKLQPSNYNSLKSLNVWIFDCFARKLDFCDKFRLWLIKQWMKGMKKFGLDQKFFVSVLRFLMY